MARDKALQKQVAAAVARDIDPQLEWVEFYHLKEGRYHLVFSGKEDAYHAPALPGFWLQVEWLWQDPLPAVDDVLLKVGGDVYARHLIGRLRQHGFLPPAESSNVE
jgi:hypothetical protein